MPDRSLPSVFYRRTFCWAAIYLLFYFHTVCALGSGHCCEKAHLVIPLLIGCLNAAFFFFFFFFFFLRFWFLYFCSADSFWRRLGLVSLFTTVRLRVYACFVVSLRCCLGRCGFGTFTDCSWLLRFAGRCHGSRFGSLAYAYVAYGLVCAFCVLPVWDAHSRPDARVLGPTPSGLHACTTPGSTVPFVAGSASPCHTHRRYRVPDSCCRMRWRAVTFVRSARFYIIGLNMRADACRAVCTTFGSCVDVWRWCAADHSA